jgi:opacity protein-like surface antigen
MNRSHNHHRSVLFGIALLAVALPASAQEDRGDFSAGWRFLKATNVGIDSTTETYPFGWYADGSFNVDSRFAIVGELSGDYKSIDTTETVLGVTVSNSGSFKIHTFMGGLRYTSRQSPDMTPFVQVLFGLAHASASIDQSVTPSGLARSDSESANEFAFDVGGGVTIAATERVDLRVSGSYLRIGADEGANGLRLGVGVAFPF